jgi:uncharacterized protein (DUF1697 family)
MPRFVAFLRGMNLGGRRISNDDLRAAFEGLELTEVATFRASGNVIFDGPDGVGGTDLSAKIEAGLADALGMATDEDLLAIEGSELYWLPSGGISETDLDLKTLESGLGPWTMRTMGTVEQIAAKHCG